jgi:uncharacterized protein (TIGR02217 family)
MAFDLIRLPDDIESGAKGGPAFRTSILPLSSGAEQRNEDWQDSRQAWDIGYGVQNKADYSVVRDFFYARRAASHGFLFKDWSDYSVTGQLLGTGDGSTRTFLLIQTKEATGPNPYERRITRPVGGTLHVYLNGVETFAFTTGDGGWIKLNTAPGAGVAVTADFEFDVPVRFVPDEFPLQLAWIEAGTIGSLPIVEIRDPFNAAPTAVTFTGTTTTLAENASTATHTHVADIEVTDDPFGTDLLTLTGTDAANFEIVGTLNGDRVGAALYLKAGVSLSYLKKNSYAVTVNVDDASLSGTHPQASAVFTLNITQVNLPPSVSLYNTTVVEPNGTSTASPIHVADVQVLDDGLGLHALTLSGADALKFTLSGALSATGTDPTTGKTIYTGVSLQTVAGLDYSVQKTFVCNVDVADSGLASPPQGTVAFSITFGVVPGSASYTLNTGNISIPVPNYTTLTIELIGPGAGGGSYGATGHDGTADTQIAALSLIAGRGFAAIAGSLLGGVGGTASGGDTNQNGNAGGNGQDYTKGLSVILPQPFNPTGFQFTTAPGGNNGNGANGAPFTLGPFYTFAYATGTQNVVGAAASNYGGGGAGALQYGVSSATTVGGFSNIATYAKGFPGGGGGARVVKTYTYGVTPGYPTPGTNLTARVGGKGIGGQGFVLGGDGSDGVINLTWS